MFNHLRTMRAGNKFLGVLLAAVMGLAACNRLATPPGAQLLKDAETKVREGAFLDAINLYERSLDGSIKSAEVHYRLAVLYDDKMKDPLNALHHFKRYLTLTPEGARTLEVKNAMKRDELALVTEMSGDSVLSQAEAARLRNENQKLRTQLEESRNQIHAAATSAKPTPRATHRKTPAPTKRTRTAR